MLQALFGKNLIFDYFDLELDILPLKMTLSHQNNIRNGYFSQNYTKEEVLHLYLP